MKKFLLFIFTLLVFLLGFGLPALASIDIIIENFNFDGSIQQIYDFGSRHFLVQFQSVYNCSGITSVEIAPAIGYIACDMSVTPAIVQTGEITGQTNEEIGTASIAMSGFYTDAPTGVLFGIPSDFALMSTSYIGGLITDLSPALYILIGIILGMWLIESLISLIWGKRK